MNINIYKCFDALLYGLYVLLALLYIHLYMGENQNILEQNDSINIKVTKDNFYGNES